MTAIAQLTIPARFNGPDNSANGGYTCGMLSSQVDYNIRVRLHHPPPLHRLLELRQDHDKKLQLLDQETLIASAQPYDFELVIPPAIDWGTAQQARQHYEGFRFSPFPYCFVCGTARPHGDGLEIYAGHYDENKVAAPWTPAAEFSTNGETVDELFLWTAMDCPGAYAIPNKGDRAVVLGQMATQFLRPVLVETPHIITGWTIAVDGRKVQTGTALFTVDKQLCAVAEQTWIILKS